MLPWDFQLLVATRVTGTELIMPTLLHGVCRGRGVMTPCERSVRIWLPDSQF